jgi:hypothetical protein
MLLYHWLLHLHIKNHRSEHMKSTLWKIDTIAGGIVKTGFRILSIAQVK